MGWMCHCIYLAGVLSRDYLGWIAKIYDYFKCDGVTSKEWGLKSILNHHRLVSNLFPVRKKVHYLSFCWQMFGRDFMVDEICLSNGQYLDMVRTIGFLFCLILILKTDVCFSFNDGSNTFGWYFLHWMWKHMYVCLLSYINSIYICIYMMSYIRILWWIFGGESYVEIRI